MIKKPSKWVDMRVYYNNKVVGHPIQAVCSFAYFSIQHQIFIGKLDNKQAPKTYEEAMEHKFWKDSVDAEIKAMEHTQTYYEADLPEGNKAVSSKWVMTIKYKSNREIEQNKTRLVT